MSAKNAVRKPKSETAKATYEKVKFDKYDARLGTVMAKVNAVLTRKPKTMATILAEAKLERECYGHLRDLVAKKIVVHTVEGFALKK